MYFIMTALIFFFFFFNDTATTEIYTLSLHDALPISLIHNRARFVLCDWGALSSGRRWPRQRVQRFSFAPKPWAGDRKSTRLNSSHLVISYAVFCLKKKKKTREAENYHDSQHVQHTTH